MSWVLDNLALIGELTVVHLRQSVIAIALGLILSLPLGWVAWRYRLLRGWVITITGLLYTIPSLALLILLPTVFAYSALSETNLIVALTIYAVAIMVRSVTDGLDSVDEDVRRSATAMGFGGGRRFFQVELPLAGPVILAGLRVTAVSTISLATVGILVGVTNLGYLFTNGLQRRIIPEVLAGVIAVMVLALVIDGLLVLAGRAVMPWTRRAATASPRGRTAGRAAGAEAVA
ncbi:ABC transporter permease [Microbacterium thalassium]|uniref:Osmoprotectant transport system permease protein n=1 Tax=Microbacterium thalassium TaxID=362649 RepID=A0A7X0KVP0_9MICO|nr:ABC transporter permease [Microbacterium thalassium]MBB6392446.1 osmoprotectant transport system permease protein [Microbacterium thalassium]GLK23322.1 ABC transporter permease [Microbacterium thalassium]